MSGRLSHSGAMISAPAWRMYAALRLGPPGLCASQAHKRVRRESKRRGWNWPSKAAVKTIENQHGLARDTHRAEQESTPLPARPRHAPDFMTDHHPRAPRDARRVA